VSGASKNTQPAAAVNGSLEYAVLEDPNIGSGYYRINLRYDEVGQQKIGVSRADLHEGRHRDPECRLRTSYATSKAEWRLSPIRSVANSCVFLLPTRMKPYAHMPLG